MLLKYNSYLVAEEQKLGNYIFFKSYNFSKIHMQCQQMSNL